MGLLKELGIRAGIFALGFWIKYSTAGYRILTNQVGDSLGFPLNENVDLNGYTLVTDNETEKILVEAPGSVLMGLGMLGRIVKGAKMHLVNTMAGTVPIFFARAVLEGQNVAEPLYKTFPSTLLVAGGTALAMYGIMKTIERYNK